MFFRYQMGDAHICMDFSCFSLHTPIFNAGFFTLIPVDLNFSALFFDALKVFPFRSETSVVSVSRKRFRIWSFSAFMCENIHIVFQTNLWRINFQYSADCRLQEDPFRCLLHSAAEAGNFLNSVKTQRQGQNQHPVLPQTFSLYYFPLSIR